ncbi:thiamine biosynthesis lipoprotein [Pseudoalteromonas sp. BSi20652]|uniref:FAD:protein FMN transferase n=1 Tax=Pseudoalteromonas sp. BSi20652 TaxID=388384 RepID=UPI000231BA57|nr:FAD:protein FMN transferase [Pseudoalteromonas sp. BSi20652]GAA59111.1 thiamine biosynthesis lipoprotein [Pseudoalteromonas sp. BSi20652]
MGKQAISVHSQGAGLSVQFNAMASPCELLLDSTDTHLAKQLGNLVANEVWRIEQKYSRYNPNSVCTAINNSQGRAVSIDNETFALLSFAQQCFNLSQGLFDISSGILRQVWHFDGSDTLPTRSQINALLPKIGFDKVLFNESTITLPAAMELDFGGIGKEYAVDKCIQLLKQRSNVPALVNLGGDLAVTGERNDAQPWQVGIEHPGFEQQKTMVVSLRSGALATSGDAKRYLLNNGVRYSHILDPKTGWSVIDAPRSITVAAPQCIQAGMLATLGMLQGRGAHTLLDSQPLPHWIIP